MKGIEKVNSPPAINVLNKYKTQHGCTCSKSVNTVN